MSRYIEADKVLKELRLNHKDVIYIDKNDTAKRIEKIKGIDIVRCSECKYWIGVCTNEMWQSLTDDYMPQTDADDFCSYGSRSEKPNNSKERSE